jgi:hypothetical protein
MQKLISCRASFILKVLGLTIIIVAVSACSSRETESADVRFPSGTVSADSRVTVSDVNGLNARDALALANTWKTTEKGVTTFVDTKRISFEFADGKKTAVRLPDAKMVVAIAPYINTTHPCETHYMSGCQGEMASTQVKVYGKTADGLVVVDDTITTMANGFFELWLVRDLEIQLTIEYDGKRASQLISTKSNSNTCITTMRLS